MDNAADGRSYVRQIRSCSIHLTETASNRRPMPKCQNCGAFVTKVYARVFTPPGIDNPRVCPECEDKVRDGADVRDARSTRR